MPPENQNPVPTPVDSIQTPMPIPSAAPAGMHWLLKVFIGLVILGVIGTVIAGLAGYVFVRKVAQNVANGDPLISTSVDEKMPWGIPDGKYVYKTTYGGQEVGVDALEGQESETIIISGRQKLTTTAGNSNTLGGAKTEVFKYEQLSSGGKIAGVECKKNKLAIAQAFQELVETNDEGGWAKGLMPHDDVNYKCETLGQSPFGFRPGAGFGGADKLETIAGVDCLCGSHGCHAKDYPELKCRLNLGFSLDSENKFEVFSQLTEASFAPQTINILSLSYFTDGSTQSINIGSRPLLPGENLSFPALNYFIFSEEEFTIDLNKNLLGFSLFFFKPYNEEFTASIMASAVEGTGLNGQRIFSELISKKFPVNQGEMTEKDFSVELSASDIKALEDFTKKYQNLNIVYFYLKVCAKDGRCIFSKEPLLLKGDGEYKANSGRMFDILRGDN